MFLVGRDLCPPLSAINAELIGARMKHGWALNL